MINLLFIKLKKKQFYEICIFILKFKKKKKIKLNK